MIFLLDILFYTVWTLCVKHKPWTVLYLQLISCACLQLHTKRKAPPGKKKTEPSCCGITEINSPNGTLINQKESINVVVVWCLKSWKLLWLVWRLDNNFFSFIFILALVCLSPTSTNVKPFSNKRLMYMSLLLFSCGYNSLKINQHQLTMCFNAFNRICLPEACSRSATIQMVIPTTICSSNKKQTKTKSTTAFLVSYLILLYQKLLACKSVTNVYGYSLQIQCRPWSKVFINLIKST